MLEERFAQAGARPGGTVRRMALGLLLSDPGSEQWRRWRGLVTGRGPSPWKAYQLQCQALVPTAAL